MIGLMGIDGNNVLYTPSGKRLFWVPASLGRIVQKIQHWIAQKTWT